MQHRCCYQISILTVSGSRDEIGNFGEMVDIGFFCLSLAPLCGVALRSKMPSPT